MKYHNMCDVLSQVFEILSRALNSNNHPWLTVVHVAISVIFNGRYHI